MRHILAALLVLSAAVCLAQNAAPLLLRQPTVSKTHIVFNYGGDLWIADRNGGDARRLTAGAGEQTNPAFSPDGSMIAFTGEYAGNKNVYVVPASGGQPNRLTTHPAGDVVVGWTPDGKSVLFRSNRDSYYDSSDRLFTVSLKGGLPTELPLVTAEDGSFSADGTHIAYVPHGIWQRAWKRGGLRQAQGLGVHHAGTLRQGVGEGTDGGGAERRGRGEAAARLHDETGGRHAGG